MKVSFKMTQKESMDFLLKCLNKINSVNEEEVEKWLIFIWKWHRRVILKKQKTGRTNNLCME